MSKILSHTLKISAALAASLAFAGAAQAGCGTYCSPVGGTMAKYEGGHSHAASGHASRFGHTVGYTGTSTLPPLSSYFDSTRYASTAGYSSSHTTSYTMSDSQADATYGSGSISSTYSGGDVELYGFSGTPDLGTGESLQATGCPVNVVGVSQGARVLGCYNVVRQEVRPVANTTYYRVVRPVIYVRYPVPVPVPYTVNVPSYGYGYASGSRYGSACGGVNWSRYGGYGPQGGYGLGCR